MSRFWRQKGSVFDAPIRKVLTQMAVYGPEDPEYAKLIEHLDRLNQMKADERKSRVSPDTMALVFGNLAGILIIVAYEQKHVMVSRAVNFLARPDQKI